MRNLVLTFILMFTITSFDNPYISNEITYNLGSLPTVEVASWEKIPNIDTLANYIATQSKTDSVDINSMVQVMLNRFNRSDFEYISNMLYSNTSYGSGTVKNNRSDYWFTERNKKYMPLIYNEISNVYKGIRYKDMEGIYYFSNYACEYHISSDAYVLVEKTNKHRYFKAA